MHPRPSPFRPADPDRAANRRHGRPRSAADPHYHDAPATPSGPPVPHPHPPGLRHLPQRTWRATKEAIHDRPPAVVGGGGDTNKEV